MRILATSALAGSLALGLVACSDSPDAPEQSPTVAHWKAGNAVVVLVADVAADTHPDVEALGRKPGVISASGQPGTLRIAFGRQAMLTDVASLRLELQSTKGLSNVREVVNPPR